MPTATSIAVREYQKAWRLANPEKCASYTKKYRAKDPAKYKSNLRRWLKQHPEHVLDYHRKWRQSHRDKVRAASRRWRTRNPEKQKAASARWFKNNRIRVRLNERNRRATDPRFRLGKCLRARVRWAIVAQSAKKFERTLQLTGCTIEFLMGHLEAQFRPGMKWDNYGKVWEVDHIRPCVAFDLILETEQRACFHYTNLQPLFVGENRRKYCKLTLEANN